MIITFSEKDVQGKKRGGGLDVEKWPRWLKGVAIDVVDHVACILHPFITHNLSFNTIFDGNTVSNTI